MYWQIVEIAEEAMTGTHRHRPKAHDLQPRTIASMPRAQRRLGVFTGASDTSHEDERFCAVCREAIKTGEARYRLGETEYHPNCFKSWLSPPEANDGTSESPS